MMDYYKEENKELFVILADISRAFDAIPYQGLKMAMKRIKLPENCITKTI
jgi:hypothetical protein